MKINTLYFSLLLPFFMAIASCSNNAVNLTSDQVKEVKASVNEMAASIQKDVCAEGPIAWVQYFETSPDFYMASDGVLEFPDGDSASSFISNILVKKINKIELHWTNIRIDPYTMKLAGFSADYEEDINSFDNKTIHERGYFTGTAEKTSKGWQFRNAHWSSIGARQ